MIFSILLCEEFYERWVVERQLISRDWLWVNQIEMKFSMPLKMYLKNADIPFFWKIAHPLSSCLMSGIGVHLDYLNMKRLRNLVSTLIFIVYCHSYTIYIALMCFLFLWNTFVLVNKCSIVGSSYWVLWVWYSYMNVLICGTW